MARLITEYNPEISVLTESNGKEKSYYIEGIFLQGDIRNGNNRVYPMPVLDRETARYIKESIDTNRGYGELEHPEEPKIHLERVSHKIVSLKKEGKNYIGKALILDTPKGQTVKGLLKGGFNLGVSSRGVGSVEERNAVSYVQEDFRLVTAADIVADPSAPSAFVNGIMEGVVWVYRNSNWVRKAEIARKVIKNTPSRKLRMAEAKVFEDFMNDLRG
jgi:hypothetical protein